MLSNAVKEINSGKISLNKASYKYNIPKSTLHNKIQQKVPMERKMGPATVLTTEEEQRLEEWIVAKAKLGVPVCPEEVKNAVQKVLKDAPRPNKFTDDRPGNKWLKLFLTRHPDITKRKCVEVTEDAIRDMCYVSSGTTSLNPLDC